MDSFQTNIGLEVHVQLNTKTKLFCGCKANSKSISPNTCICKTCTGLPGTLPVINKKAIEQTILAGLALQCSISKRTQWDRKNYFYPDLAKGYQISQYEDPIAYKGHLEILSRNNCSRIGIRSIHLEEDTAGIYHVDKCIMLDFNRSGIPLIEIISEPDITSSEKAKNYLQTLQKILRYAGVSTCDMQNGEFRVDANVSIRPLDQKQLGTKVELKNLNSFHFVQQAIEYEINRQMNIIENGKKVKSETRGWDKRKKVTFFQRRKEQAGEYRYFPEPDLPALIVKEQWVQSLGKHIPELPRQKQQRFQQKYHISTEIVDALTLEQLDEKQEGRDHGLGNN